MPTTGPVPTVTRRATAAALVLLGTLSALALALLATGTAPALTSTLTVALLLTGAVSGVLITRTAHQRRRTTMTTTEHTRNDYLIDPERQLDDLTDAMAAGLACVWCGTPYLTATVAHRPVGRSTTGSQAFACLGECIGHMKVHSIFEKEHGFTLADTREMAP